MLADIVRLSFIPVLAWAAWSDHRTRLVPSWLWWPHVAAGSALLVSEVVGMHPAAAVKLVSPVLVLTGAALIFCAAGSFGMADVKAVAAVSVLFPHEATTAVLLALSLSLLWPLSIAFRNALSGRFGVGMASTVTVPADRLDSAHGWLADTGEDLEDVDAEKLGDGPFEVEPGVPYLVPLLLGTVLVLL